MNNNPYYSFKLNNITSNYLEYVIYQHKLGIETPFLINLKSAMEKGYYGYPYPLTEFYHQVERQRLWDINYFSESDLSRAWYVGFRVYYSTPTTLDFNSEIVFLPSLSDYTSSFEGIIPYGIFSESTTNLLRTFINNLSPEEEEDMLEGHTKLKKNLLCLERNENIFLILQQYLLNDYSNLIDSINLANKEVEAKLTNDNIKIKAHNYLAYVFGRRLFKVRSVKYLKNKVYCTYYLFNSNGSGGISICSTILSLKEISLYQSPIRLNVAVNYAFNSDSLPVRPINFYFDLEYLYFCVNQGNFKGWIKVKLNKEKYGINYVMFPKLEINKKYLNFQYLYPSFYECFNGASVPIEGIETDLIDILEVSK